MAEHSGCRGVLHAFARIGRTEVDVTAVDHGLSVRFLPCPHKVRYWLVPTSWERSRKDAP